MPNTLQHVTIGRTIRAVTLENEHLVATVLLDQGIEILELRHRNTGVDVLWKVPYPTREPGVGPPPAGDSYAQWLAFHYPCTSSLAEKAALMDLGLALLEDKAPLTFG